MIYLVRDEEYIKIGLAVRSNIVRRWMELQVGNPRPIHMRVWDEEGEYEEEKRLHLKFQNSLVRGEWFKVNSELEEMWDNSLELERKSIGRPRKIRAAAGEWLLEILDDVPILANDIRDRGKDRGFSKKTLHRAADDVGVIRKLAFKRSETTWRLP